MAGSWLSAGGTPGLAWALVCALALGLALLLDWYLGEPPLRLHPVVWMGRYLGWAGPHIAPLTTADPPPHAQKRRSFWLGALAWCTGAGAVGALAWWLQSQLQQAPWWLAAPLLAVLLKPLLAWRMLRDEVLAVERALARSLPEGREQLARLVSRDVSQLTPAEVRESAIESLAENLNDSVVAPVFWFVLLGLPGAGQRGAQNPIAQQRLAHGRHGPGPGCAAGQAGGVHLAPGRACAGPAAHAARCGLWAKSGAVAYSISASSSCFDSNGGRLTHGCISCHPARRAWRP